MDKETAPIQEKTKSKGKLKLQIIFSALLATAVFVIELYAMINQPQQYIVIGVFAILLLLFLYLMISGILNQLTLKEQDRQDQYESIFKSEKASYITQKKNYEEFTEKYEKISEKLSTIEKNTKLPIEEIIGSQKGVAKVVINRNRENAEAILNSNDVLIERISNLEKLVSSNNAELTDTYKEGQDDSLQQLLKKHQELMIGLKDMELRLNNMIVQAQKNMPAPMPIVTAAPVASPIAAAPVPVSEPEIVKVAEPVPEPEPVKEIESAPMPEPEPAKVVEPVSEPEPVKAAEPEPEPKPKPVSKPKRAAKSKAASKIKPVKAVEPAPKPEPPKEEPPKEEEKPPMPDMSDPNKKMSADDIAALFANMAGDSAPAAEPEPPKEEPPKEEEKPPMPDMSDPNKKMSADEIAALFANMA